MLWHLWSLSTCQEIQGTLANHALKACFIFMTSFTNDVHQWILLLCLNSIQTWSPREVPSPWPHLESLQRFNTLNWPSARTTATAIPPQHAAACRKPSCSLEKTLPQLRILQSWGLRSIPTTTPVLYYNFLWKKIHYLKKVITTLHKLRYI